MIPLLALSLLRRREAISQQSHIFFQHRKKFNAALVSVGKLDKYISMRISQCEISHSNTIVIDMMYLDEGDYMV